MSKDKIQKKGIIAGKLKLAIRFLCNVNGTRALIGPCSLVTPC